MDKMISELSFKRETTLENTFAYMGSLMAFLVEGKDNNGQFAMMEYRAKPGNEPPPHIHELEDEMLYILEGEIEAHVDDSMVRVGAGSCLFIPKGKPHAWYILSPQFRMLIMVQPAFSDRYFREMVTPTQDLELPRDAITYAMSDPEHAVAIAAKYGVRILSPEETKKALPKYDGFGVRKG